MPKNSSVKKVKAVTSKPKPNASPRKLAAPTYNSFRLQKRRAKPQVAKIQSSFRLFRQSLSILKGSWKVFLGIVLVYTLLNLLLVQGYFNFDLSSAQAEAQALMAGNWGKIVGGFSGLSYLFGHAGADPTTGAYRVILTVIMSLAIIWALRQVLADKHKKVRVRDTFYAGMYPLAPFVLVFLLICLQLVPLTLAMYLMGIAGVTNGVEVLLWTLILGALGALTFYWLSSSIFALYIACLPGVQPVEAVRSAVQLVRHRRWFVLRRVLFLPFILFVSVSIVVVPLIVLFSPAAIAVFFIFLMTVLPIVHSYMYLLYRELLNAQ
jgi:hypothetical protein